MILAVAKPPCSSLLPKALPRSAESSPVITGSAGFSWKNPTPRQTQFKAALPMAPDPSKYSHRGSPQPRRTGQGEGSVRLQNICPHPPGIGPVLRDPPTDMARRCASAGEAGRPLERRKINRYRRLPGPGIDAIKAGYLYGTSVTSPRLGATACG